MNNETLIKELQMGKTIKKLPKIVYSEKALKYFQEMNDKDEFMTEPGNGDYVNYLLGDDIGNGIGGQDMEVSFDELDGDSDWYMD
jgi:hypothetical protein